MGYISWAFLGKVLGGACCGLPQEPWDVGQVFALEEEEKCLLDSSLVLFEILEDLCASSSFF